MMRIRCIIAFMLVSSCYKHIPLHQMEQIEMETRD